MARLLIVADNSQLLTEIYPVLAPAGFAVIETVTSATTALRLLHHTPHHYVVLAQVDAYSDLGYTFADLVELDHEVRSRHAFVFFTALPTHCIPPAALRLGYVLLSLPFHPEDLLNALSRPQIAILERPSLSVNLQGESDAKREQADHSYSTGFSIAHKDDANMIDPADMKYSLTWVAGNGSLQQPPESSEYANSLA